MSRHLENFLALHQAHSMRRAAELKGISQPALTKSLKLLEGELRARLFRCTNTGLEPTEAGEAVHRHALVMNQEARFAAMEVADLHTTLGGRIRIGVGPIPAVSTFAGVLTEFRRAFPSVEPIVETGISGHLTERLERGRLDVVFASSPRRAMPAAIAVTPLLSTEMVVICRRDHPLASKGGVSLREMARCGRVGFLHDVDFEAGSRRALRSGSEALRPIMQTSSIALMFGVLAETDHFAIVGSIMLPRTVREGLRVVTVREPLWSIELSMMCRASLSGSRPIRAIVRSVAGAEPRDGGG